LAKTNCIFSLANAIEFLKFGLVNALAERRVSLNTRLFARDTKELEIFVHTWDGKYISMALMPMFCGREDIV
jgi:hypothetical protein